MKNIIVFFSAISCALLIAACNKIETKDGGEAIVKQGVLSATIEPATKTSLDNDGVSVLWSDSDALAVLSNDDWTFTQYTLLDGEGSKSGIFTGNLKLGNNFLAIYPYDQLSLIGNNTVKLELPSQQTYVENGFESNLMPMYAVGRSLENMNFQYIGGIIRINLYAATSGINVTSITFRPNQVTLGTKLQFWEEGRFDAPTIDGGIPADNTIVLDCSGNNNEGVELSTDENNPTVFNIVALAGSVMATGFVITVNTTDAGSMVLSKTNQFLFNRGYAHSFTATEYEDNISSNNKQVLIDGEEMSLEKLSTAAADDSYIPASSVAVRTDNGEKLTSADIDLVLSIVSRAENPVALDLSGSEYISYVFRTIENTKIGSVKLPSNITNLPRFAFQNCSNLTTIDLTTTAGINTIGYEIIAGTKVTTLNIPASVSSLPENNSLGMQASLFTTYNVDPSNTHYKSVDGVLFNKAGTRLMDFPYANEGNDPENKGHYIIPDGVQVLQTYAIQQKKFINWLTFPTSVTECNFRISFNISKITCLGETPFGGISTMFDSSCSNGTVYVPSGCASAYTSNSLWDKLFTTKNWTIVDDGSQGYASLAAIGPLDEPVIIPDSNYWNSL